MGNSSRLRQFGAALPLLSDGQSLKMSLAFENTKFSVPRAGLHGTIHDSRVNVDVNNTICRHEAYESRSLT